MVSSRTTLQFGIPLNILLVFSTIILSNRVCLANLYYNKLHSKATTFFCDAKKVVVSNVMSHAMTNRPLVHYTDMQLPFLPVFQILSGIASNGSVLEIGAGSGRAILELQSLFPELHVFGSNLAAYGHSQAESTDELMLVAAHFGIRLPCNKTSVTVPKIHVTVPLQHPDFPRKLLPAYDFVFSRHALNQGKLKPHESCLVVPRVLSLLKPSGGLALLNLLYRGFDGMDPELSFRPILHSWTISPEGTRENVTFLLYQTMCERSTNCINLMIKRCSTTSQYHPRFGGCIIPIQYDSRTYQPVKSKALLQAMYLSVARQSKTLTRVALHMKYAWQYMRVLMFSLEAWHELNSIPSMVVACERPPENWPV
jgi:SAM-dependent methyltransferase